jgi:hypothetical protein
LSVSRGGGRTSKGEDGGEQAALAEHRVRQLLESQHKQLANQLRDLLAEFGVVPAQGSRSLSKGLAEGIERAPAPVQPVLKAAHQRLRDLERQCQGADEPHRALGGGRRLMRERGVADHRLGVRGDVG